ncbi:methyltransferase domain-containing protein [Acaryochloris marina S15]|nr:methyltransferase domain-containing protein [Acaryochloris marina S15]
MAYNCALCGSDKRSLIYGKGRHVKNVKNYICEQCGFVFVLPRPSATELENLYAGGGFSRNERSLHKPDDAKFKQCEALAFSRFQTLQNHLKSELYSPNDQKNILEIGCGTASFLRLMKGAGWKVSGLEPDSVYTSVVEQRYGLSIENTSLEYYLSEDRFDVISSFHVIEHVPDPNSFLSRIYDLLQNDGLLYIECPSIDRWYGESIDFFFWDVHINTFSETVLRSFMLKNGFEPIESGWHGNGLWIIAQKKAKALQSTLSDDPRRIKKIVVDANDISSSKRSRTAKQYLVAAKRRLKNQLKSWRDKTPQDLCNAENVAVTPVETENIRLKIAHIGLHANDNAGDTLLFPAIRWLFQQYVSPTQFELIPLRGKVTEQTIDIINTQDAVLIGGGGLFLSDSNLNELSGWQWACPIELLEKIQVPIIVFAVGYNRFRGQPEFSPKFRESVEKLVRKSAFFGIRNRGSMEALKQYLPPELHSKITFQPCATTFLQKFYPKVETHDREPGNVIAVNIAFDRHHLRFGKREDEILWSVADALLELKNKGWCPKMFMHMRTDAEAYAWFRARGLELEQINLHRAPPDVIIREYRKISLAFGMRGHAQMIPFGLGKAIYSLISHDKLRFFLEDIHHQEWGAEIQGEDLRSTLVTDMTSIGQKIDEIEDQVKRAQEGLWEITLRNLADIKKILKIL